MASQVPSPAWGHNSHCRSGEVQPFLITGECMDAAAKSLVVFGVYLLLNAVGLVFTPNIVLGLFGLPATTSPGFVYLALLPASSATTMSLPPGGACALSIRQPSAVCGTSPMSKDRWHP